MATLGAPSAALATDATPPSTNGSTTPPKLVEIRVAVSTPAAKKVSEQRVRQLLEIEVQDIAVVAPGATGPLGDYVAYVWFDQPGATSLSIEVRVGDRPVARREIKVDGLSGDVAARLGAIAASEMVRAQMLPSKPTKKPTPPPRKPTPEELELSTRQMLRVNGLAAARVAVLPGVNGAIVGPSLALGFSALGLRERLFGSWLAGSTSAGGVRAFELGLSGEYDLAIGTNVRLLLGGAASLVSLHLGDATSVDGALASHDALTGRAGALIGVETHLHGPLWLSIMAEPGALLRRVPYANEGGARAFEGAWLGLSAGLSVERFVGPHQ